MTSIRTGDPRIDGILDLVSQLAAGNLQARGTPSAKDDELDAIITGINMLAEQFATSHIARGYAERRIDEILEVFMAFARLDFAKNAPVTGEEEQLDALSTAVNMLGEELRSSHERLLHINQMLRSIRKVNQLIATESDRRALIEKTCVLLVGSHGCCAAGIALLDGAGKFELMVEADGGCGSMNGHILAGDERAPCVQNALSRHELILVGPERDMCLSCRHAAFCKFDSGMLVPIEHNRKTLGLLRASTEVGLVVDEEERALFQEIALDIGLALSKIAAEEQHRIAEEDLKTAYAHMITAQDEVAKAHAELKDTVAQVVHSAKLAALGEMSAGVAHELKQPLNGIKLTVQSILRALQRGRYDFSQLEGHAHEMVGQVNCRLRTEMDRWAIELV